MAKILKLVIICLVEKFLLGLSAYRNTRALFKISSKKNPEMLHCLNGIRFISMTWVVLGHVYGNFGNYPTNNNLIYTIKVTKSLIQPKHLMSFTSSLRDIGAVRDLYYSCFFFSAKTKLVVMP